MNRLNRKRRVLSRRALSGRALFVVLCLCCANGPAAAIAAEEQSLEKIARPFGAIVKLVKEAAQEGDAKEASALFSQAWDRFLKEIQGPLNSFIADLNQKIAALQKDSKEVPGAMLQARDQAELTRVKIYLVFARAHPKSLAKRKEFLDKALELADTFVDLRFNFPPMQFDGQLQRGILAFELEQYGLAVEHLGILFEPLPVQNPSPVLVVFLKNLRLQAVLYGARALNARGNFERAGRTIQEHFLTKSESAIDISTAEDVKGLKAFAVQVRLELAVALAGVGKAEKGLAVVHGIINKYNAEQTPEAQGFVTDARQVLGRISAVPGVQLRGRDYYQAGLGLKSEYKMVEALRLFQAALGGLTPRQMAASAPLCLNEIGEINFLLGKAAQDAKQPGASIHFTNSALAYREICAYFSASPLIGKAATNFLAAATRAVNTTQGGSSHAGLRELETEAKQASQQYGNNIQIAEALMQDGQRMEKQGDYEEAREKYLQVPPKVKELEVPFYWRAQASAQACTLRLWERAPEDQKEERAKDLGKAAEELTKILPKALETGDKSGAATAALTLGFIRYHQEEWQKAADVLQVFTTDLQDMESYRCAGWGYLCLALVRLGDCSGAEGVLKTRLSASCREEEVLAVVAFQLAECFRINEEKEKCAEYMRMYSKHPSSQGDMQKLEMVRIVIKRLIDGGGEKNIETAQKLTKTAEELAKAEGADFGEELDFYQAKIYLAEEAWDKAITALLDYVKKYKPRGLKDNDAYAWRHLAEAYMKRSGRNVPPTKDAQKAERYQGYAVSILNSWREKDKNLEREFWKWSLDWLLIKKLLGDAGQPEKYGEIVLFVETRKDEEMGGPDLKAQFLQLLNFAQQRVPGVKGN